MNCTTINVADQVRAFLSSSVTEVFGTMFGLEAKPAVPHDLSFAKQILVAGSVGFIGDVNGVVYVHVTSDFARRLASRMLGLSESELGGDELVNDVIGELSNMVVGSVKSHLCDAGMPCVLTIPSVVRGQELSIEQISSSERRLMGFRAEEDYIQVELLIKRSR